MNRPLLSLMIAGIALASNAQAANSSVENALKNRSDLSSFYQALVNTGVINELNQGVSYTILAPTNEAFAKLSPASYPCLYSIQCRAETAALLRNHIVVNEHHLHDVADHRDALFSIDNRNINVSEPSRGHFAVEGHTVLNQQALMGGELYTIDGVIANERELVAFSTLKNPPAVYVPPSDSAGIENEYVPAAGAPATVTRTTTTTTRTVTIPAQ